MHYFGGFGSYKVFLKSLLPLQSLHVVYLNVTGVYFTEHINISVVYLTLKNNIYANVQKMFKMSLSVDRQKSWS